MSKIDVLMVSQVNVWAVFSEKVKKFFLRYRNDLLALLILFASAMITCLIVFKPGFYEGHDTIFHANQVWSYYQSLKNGDFAGWISPGICRDFGVSIRTMYSSLSHTFTALCLLFLEPMGFTMTTAFKFVHFLTLFFSGIFAYQFGKSLFNKSNGYALVVGLVFMLNPYHLTLIYVRNAFAENFAYTFIPLFFLAIFQIINEEKPRDDIRSVKPFFTLMIGTGLSLVSHNITALYTAFFGVIYLILSFRPRKMLSLLKDPYFYLFSSFSIVGAIVIYLPILVPLLEFSNPALNLRIFKDIMNANYQGVINSMKDSGAFFSFSISDTKFPVIIIVVSITAVAIATLKNFLPAKYRRLAVVLVYFSGLAASSLIYALLNDRSPIGGLLLFGIGILLYFMCVLSKDRENNTLERIRLQEGVAFAVLGIICVIMMTCKEVWKILPEVFYKIQFTFRLWTFVYFFFALSLLIFVHKIQERKRDMGLVLPMLIISLSSISRYTNTGYMNKYGVTAVQDYDHDSLVALGWQYEYLSDYFWQDADYKTLPSYYYNVIATSLFYNSTKYDRPILPNIADLSVVESAEHIVGYTYNSVDGASFELAGITESTFVIMPLFYYPGYKVTLHKDNRMIDIKARNVKGLLNFDVETDGKYTIKYVGTKAMNFSVNAFLTLVPIFIIGALEISSYSFYRKKQKKLAGL